MGSKVLKTIFAVFMISILILPVFARAYTLLEPLPSGLHVQGDLSANITLEHYLKWIFDFALIATGFLAVLMIVIGGVRYMIGGANESERSEGKKYISSALWGLLLAFGAWLIINTINPELVNLSFTLPEPAKKVQPQDTSTAKFVPRVNIIDKDSVRDCQQKIFDQNPGKGPEDLFDQLIECDKLKDVGGLEPPKGN